MYYCSRSQHRLLPSIPDSVPYYCSHPFPTASRTIACVPNRLIRRGRRRRPRVNSGRRHVLLLAFPTPIAPVHPRQLPNTDCSRPFRTASHTIAPIHSRQPPVLLLAFPTKTYKTRTPKASEGPFRTASCTIARDPNIDCSRPFRTASHTIAPIHSRQPPVLLFAFPTQTYKTRTPKASEGPFRTASRTIARVPNTDL